MIIPVRCFSCGRVIASDYGRYIKRVNEIKAEGRDPSPEEIEKIFDDLGIERYCCRRMIVSHVDLISEIMPFS
ncbi:DNA-directed RNA polymerase, chain N related protein [Thermoplasma acidophilum]|uniref:DNA-directed RNA polymerase subunit Rpo10 n=1 Tax=Thermoplasma acidophilum (strain ATCC 25905 / DSM 1728 / JCM 9062 / NBRC 15155 / AMRC-C165) TaxID=273075 RepID=RPO10_THEAC|nr:DNA-directed RNA polymerase subunit N [Thermoplasma acidophilum]Q9HL09.1 RecName: Full=DNA-directed RNA polymerase subunit Rpo10; AltName: Full=DNA-directed RNA polymerase subunit N [Thermoplasma acidophilum DSM 1728]MCY0851267.1 DNA-directed RNA polymerase subunit N [Thermoplasma acidophilum]CAC11573.1 DNA-directed RNA polymerase, chain N related protein [Thermoplasma acidophilum]